MSAAMRYPGREQPEPLTWDGKVPVRIEAAGECHSDHGGPLTKTRTASAGPRNSGRTGVPTAVPLKVRVLPTVRAGRRITAKDVAPVEDDG